MKGRDVRSTGPSVGATDERAVVGIVGAGPGGLTAARVLQRHGISAAVFDSRPGLSGSASETLVLHPDSGRRAMRYTGLLDTIVAQSVPERTGVRLLGRDGTVHYADDGGRDARANPEVAQHVLEATLLDSLTPGTVRWSHRLTAIRDERDDGLLLRFDNGRSVRVAAVVGADGGWSRVRETVASVDPSYLGVVFAVGWCEDSGLLDDELIGDGDTFALSDNKALFVYRPARGATRVVAGFRAGMNWLIDGPFEQAGREAASAALHAIFYDWAPPFRKLLDGRIAFDIHPAYALPASFTWRGHPRLTLVGDAAHMTAPFFSQGANLAMLDGAEAGTRIAESLHRGTSLDAALRGYEESMLTRSRDLQVWAADGLDHAVAPDAPGSALRHLRVHRNRAWPNSSTKRCHCMIA
ncbi:Salicylate 1-monooxygenase [Nocardia gamkensis]|nr:Salicylate 1-monooxygenase [Nocardia gamkensis]